MNEITYPVFAKRIQQVMTENGWNKSDLAKKVMLSHTAVQNWAKGKSVASGERLKRLAAATGKPEHWFFLPSDETDDKPDQTLSSNRDLDEKELMILSLFNQLPESEKLRLILHTKGVLHDIELLKNDVYDLINNQKNRKRNPLQPMAPLRCHFFALQRNKYFHTHFTTETLCCIIYHVDNKRIVVRW